MGQKIPLITTDLYEAICEVVESKCLNTWFDTPNVSFDGLTPYEMIDLGKQDELWEMVKRLR